MECVNLVRLEFYGCWGFGLSTREVLETLNSNRDREEDGGPQRNPVDALEPAILHLGDGLPRLVNLFDAPALRIAKNDELRILEGRAWPVRQQEPIDGLHTFGH